MPEPQYAPETHDDVETGPEYAPDVDETGHNTPEDEDEDTGDDEYTPDGDETQGLDPEKELNAEDTEDPNDPDKINFGEEVKIGDYDLTDFKDKIDFTDKATTQLLDAYAAKYKELGISQEQAVKLLEMQLETPQTEEISVKEKLEKELSYEEKRNYGAVKNYVSDMLAGTEFEAHRADMLANPQLVKLFNAMYKKANGLQAGNKGPVIPAKEKRMETMGANEALEVFQRGIRAGKAAETLTALKGKVNIDVYNQLKGMV